MSFHLPHYALGIAKQKIAKFFENEQDCAARARAERWSTF